MSRYDGVEKERTSAGQIFIRIICAILGLLVGCSLYVFKVLGGFRYVMTPIVSKEDYKPMALGEDDLSFTGGDVTSSWSEGGHTRVFVDPDHPIIEVAQKDPDIENILIFGVDARGTDDYRCRSDAMIVMSVDGKHDKVKLTSLMRDTGVYIGDTAETQSGKLDKLTHAYAYGGVGLMINTINLNFDLDIQRFIMLDFGSASDIIDLVGGIDIDVTDGEVDYANRVIAEMNTLVKDPAPMIAGPGMQRLSGVQAIGWSRIRKLDSDFVRTSRQRVVASALINRVKEMNYLEQMATLEDATGIFETNMQTLDIARIGLNGASGASDITEFRVPEDGLFSVQENPWMMIVNMDEQRSRLRAFIWEE